MTITKSSRDRVLVSPAFRRIGTREGFTAGTLRSAPGTDTTAEEDSPSWSVIE